MSMTTETGATTETGPQRTSEFAIASLTMGIVTFVNVFAVERAVPAIVFGLLGMRRLKADDRLKGKGLAISGVVLGVIGVIVLPALGVKFLPQLQSLLAGPSGTVALDGDPDPAGAVVQLRKSVAAIESARAWLELVDAGQYAEAWEASASANQAAITKDGMVELYNSVRAPAGTVVSRTFKSANYTTSLPSAPAGEYVVVEFNTTFDNNRRFLERITPMLDTNDGWKVSGYYLLQ